jgi:Fe-S cluster biosynthesis and repair protein YggX
MTEQRMVNCIKLNQELPGLTKPPVPGELGQKVYDNVSKQAFQMFLDHFKMIANEYRLDFTSESSDKIFMEQMNEFFFGGGAELPEGFTPPSKTEPDDATGKSG